MEPLQTFNRAISWLFLICYAYQFFYIAVPFLFRHKPHGPAAPHRYAILISARNEEAVIRQLIDSIRAQSYDASLLTVFVLADNCTDRTARLARDAGAVVYERFDRTRVGKGYALHDLLAHLAEDYPADAFDGYFIFDADNILDSGYIEAMNRTFSDGHEIVTSYRNSKNYGDNWISAGYGLWFLRDAQYLNNSRMLLGTSCSVAGTGFLFSRGVLERCGGWNCFLLSEDIEFSVERILAGERIAYCPDAVFYDEQPVTFRQSWKQRLRWAKGYLQVFRRYGAGLLRGVFGGSFACFDMCMTIMPAIVVSVFSVLVNAAAAIVELVRYGGVLTVILSFLGILLRFYWTIFLAGAVTTATEWRQIHTSAWKKVLYTFTFPLFMMTYIPIALTAFVRPVTWEPIQHTRTKELSDILNGK